MKMQHLYPSNGLAALSLGTNSFRQLKYVEAARWLATAVDLFRRTFDGNDGHREYRNLVIALNNLAQSYREISRLNHALDALDEALRVLEHVARDPRATYELDSVGGLKTWTKSNLYTIRGLVCEWKDSELLEHALLLETRRRYEVLSQGHQLHIGALILAPLDAYTFLLLHHRTLADDLACARLSTGWPLLPWLPQAQSVVHATGDRRKDEDEPEKSFSSKPDLPVLHVGYLSYDWRDHPMGRLTKRLVVSHNMSRVRSVSVSYGHNDNSDVRKYVKKHSPEFHDLFAVTSDYEAAAIIASMRLDILVDLNSHTFNGRIDIVARKPAPVIVSYLGFPGTSGCVAVDYYFADSRTVPPDTVASSFSERLLYLPGSYQANDMPLNVQLCVNNDAAICRDRLASASVQTIDEVLNAPADSELEVNLSQTRGSYPNGTGRRAMGRLQDTRRPLLCSFNSVKKMEPRLLYLWASILRRVPAAQLVLLKTDSSALENIRKQLYAVGVDPDRVLIVPSVSTFDSHDLLL